MLWKLPAGSRNRRHSQATRCLVALLSVVALLFQAILSAWHHHTHPFLLHGLSAVSSTAVADRDPGQQSADDDCQICFALGHRTAAPVDFFAAPLVDHELSLLLSAATVSSHPLPYLLFRSRAPPRA